MEKPKKQILWKPSNERNPTKKEITPKLEQEVKKEEPNSNVSNGKKLSEWIKKADLINKSALCKKSGIDRANLDKYISKGEIPEQHIQPLLLILKYYGYAE